MGFKLKLSYDIHFVTQSYGKGLPHRVVYTLGVDRNGATIEKTNISFFKQN
jgi:hypothetical protein